MNRPQTEAELEALREHVRRSRPYGDDRWMRRTAAKLKLESTLRSHGGKRRRIGTKAGEV